MKKIIRILCPLAILIASNFVLAEKAGHSHHHNHGQLEISSLSDKPTVSIDVVRDSVSGWNIHVKTTHFRFAPENANQQAILGEGHAHLFVDGKKKARLYGPWFHLENLSPGKHTIMVSLNTNKHAGLVLNGEPVADVEEVIQK